VELIREKYLRESEVYAVNFHVVHGELLVVISFCLSEINISHENRLARNWSVEKNYFNFPTLTLALKGNPRAGHFMGVCCGL